MKVNMFNIILQVGWYWGPLSWDEAENKIANKPDGSFLVRDSSDDRYILSLSFRSQNLTHHTRIEHYKGKMMNCRISLRKKATIQGHYPCTCFGFVNILAISPVGDAVDNTVSRVYQSL